MNSSKTNWSQAFKFMGAVLAFAIGSGFASGQELLQYFTAYGYESILVGIVFLTIFIYSNYCFAIAGHREKFTKGSQVFNYYCGPYLGKVFDYFSVLFCYMSFIVMDVGNLQHHRLRHSRLRSVGQHRQRSRAADTEPLPCHQNLASHFVRIRADHLRGHLHDGMPAALDGFVPLHG